jgi:hypothetical protein
MIEGKFISMGTRFFPIECVSQIFSREIVERIESGIAGRKYLLIADWGMSNTGDPSWFFVLDYTDYLSDNKIKLVSHQKIVGGSPTMQLATLRVIYQNFGGGGKKDDEGNVIWHPVIFITDTNSLGGIIIKKMLFDLHPVSFDSHGNQKDQMLASLNEVVNFNREFVITSTGDLIENNPDFGKLRSYFIEELEEQMGGYQVDDKKIEQDAVMTLGMGIWYLERRIPKNINQKIDLNPNSRYNEIRGIK